MAEENVIDMPLGTTKISELLKISESAIRKYALALEKAGYEFEKSGTTRHYKHDDVEVLRTINQLTENHKLNVENAVTLVMSKQRKSPHSEAVENAVVEQNSLSNQQHVNELATVEMRLSHQQNMVENLLTVIKTQNDESQTRHNELLKQIEQQEKTNQDLNDKLQLAVDMIQRLDEKMDKIEEKEKKSFFKRLFG